MRMLRLTQDEFVSLYELISETYEHLKHETVETENDTHLYTIYQKLTTLKRDNLNGNISTMV